MSEIDSKLKACEDCNEAERVRYIVTVILSDKAWQEEIKRYVFIDPMSRFEVKISENKEVTFDYINYDFWRITDLLEAGIFEQITLRKIQNEKV